MKREYQDFFCEQIRQFWLSLPSRPWGVWIREHEPISVPEYSLTTAVSAAWFLDSETISVRKPSDFVRFLAIHSAGAWHCGIQPPPSGIFRQGMHDIGLAGFAAVADTERFYFEWQFGVLFGKGSTYAPDNAGHLHLAEEIFIS